VVKDSCGVAERATAVVWMVEKKLTVVVGMKKTLRIPAAVVVVVIVLVVVQVGLVCFQVSLALVSLPIVAVLGV
jgi:hypothetical protein